MKKSIYVFCCVLIFMIMNISFGMENNTEGRINTSTSCEQFGRLRIIKKIPREKREAYELFAKSHNNVTRELLDGATDAYKLSSIAFKNIWNRLSTLEILLMAIMRGQGILSTQSYQNVMFNALNKYVQKDPHHPKTADWETFMINEALITLVDEKPHSFLNPETLKKLLEERLNFGNRENVGEILTKLREQYPNLFINFVDPKNVGKILTILKEQSPHVDPENLDEVLTKLREQYPNLFINFVDPKSVGKILTILREQYPHLFINFVDPENLME